MPTSVKRYSQESFPQIDSLNTWIPCWLFVRNKFSSRWSVRHQKSVRKWFIPCYQLFVLFQIEIETKHNDEKRSIKVFPSNKQFYAQYIQSLKIIKQQQRQCDNDTHSFRALQNAIDSLFVQVWYPGWFKNSFVWKICDQKKLDKFNKHTLCCVIWKNNWLCDFSY